MKMAQGMYKARGGMILRPFLHDLETRPRPFAQLAGQLNGQGLEGALGHHQNAAAAALGHHPFGQVARWWGVTENAGVSKQGGIPVVTDKNDVVHYFLPQDGQGQRKKLGPKGCA
jgi:hypothetical protein